ncbi:MAG: hypothetical protein I8H71_01130 [Xanthomonadaceae bacterium]|nr:hypothetical protein [Xanthomonadaceae bacterium]
MSGILAFLAGAGGGAMKGYQMRRDKDADDELKKARAEDRAWQTEQRDRERKQSAVQDRLQQDLRAAAQPVAMAEGAGGMVRPETMDNRDVGLPENQAQTDAGLMPVAYRVGAQGYADRGAAQTAVTQENRPEAVNQRVMAAYQGAGMPEKAMQLQAAQRQAAAGDLQLQQAQDADKRDKAFREVVTAFKAGGWGAIPKIYDGYDDGLSAQVQEDGKGGATVISVGADGKEAFRQSFANPMEFITGQVARMDPKLWLGMETQRAERQDARALQAATVARTQANTDRTHQLQVDRNAEVVRHNQATESAAAAKAKTSPAKPLPTAALKMVQEGKDAIGTASSINADLSAINQQITDGKLKFGPMSNLANAGLNAIGASTEESRNFATFKANMEKLRNDSLRLNKGVQTDGDAQRAWNELFQSINDTKVVQQRLGEIMRLNERAVQLRKLDIDGVLQNYGHEPMDTSAYTNQPTALGSGSAPAGRAKAPAAGARVAGEGGKSYVFKGGDPKDRANWEPAK